MHVGFNLIYLIPGETGGMEVYGRELILGLVAAAPETRFTAFVNMEAASDPDAQWGEPVETVTVPVHARHRIEWVRGEQTLLPQLAARAGIDLLHSLGGTAPAWGPFRRVVTIHDLNYRIVPEAHLGLLGHGMRILVPAAARRSHRIIVPAAATRADLQRLLGTRAGKIDVVYEGLGRTRREAPIAEDELRAWLGGDARPIVLSVSAKRPHKNLLRLIGAASLIPKERRPLLVLPGYPTAHEDELRRQAVELCVDADVRLLGWVDDAHLEGLYAAASCFVFPSLYEGFGLPVLEAMARGVPVACSGRGALDEIAGDAALRFDPESEPAIARAIERLVADGAERERLRVAGFERAFHFTWAAAAAGTLASYERAMGGV
jgi:glycosyltransferase involved in cell wall biosynthesis